VSLAVGLASALWLLGVEVRPGTWAVLAAVLTLLAVGIASALVYALVFEHVTRRARWLMGAAVGAIHGSLLAAAIGIVPWMADRSTHGSVVPSEWIPLGAPHAGCALAAILAGGVGFGAIVAALYGAPRHGRGPQSPVRWRELYPTARRFP
jgi:hypothetical protein